jgi:hypothetical protein
MPVHDYEAWRRGYTTEVQARAAANIVGDRYRISGLLGEGGMARVFEAFDERLQRRVVMKILRPETEALAGMRTRFQQEARIAQSLSLAQVLLSGGGVTSDDDRAGHHAHPATDTIASGLPLRGSRAR